MFSLFLLEAMYLVFIFALIWGLAMIGIFIVKHWKVFLILVGSLWLMNVLTVLILGQ